MIRVVNKRDNVQYCLLGDEEVQRVSCRAYVHVLIPGLVPAKDRFGLLHGDQTTVSHLVTEMEI